MHQHCAHPNHHTRAATFSMLGTAQCWPTWAKEVAFLEGNSHIREHWRMTFWRLMCYIRFCTCRCTIMEIQKKKKTWALDQEMFGHFLWISACWALQACYPLESMQVMVKGSVANHELENVRDSVMSNRSHHVVVMHKKLKSSFREMWEFENMSQEAIRQEYRMNQIVHYSPLKHTIYTTPCTVICKCKLVSC